MRLSPLRSLNRCYRNAFLTSPINNNFIGIRIRQFGLDLFASGGFGRGILYGRGDNMLGKHRP